MLVTLIPMFDKNMAVGAYSLFTMKENCFLNPSSMGTGSNDGAGNIEGLSLISTMGIDTLSGDKPVFVSVNCISVFSDIDAQCDAPHSRIVLVIKPEVTPTENNIKRLKELKKNGYNLAIRKLNVSQFEEYRQILMLVDYVFLDEKKIAIDKARIYFSKLFPDIKLCAEHVSDMDRFLSLKNEGGYTYYEGDFYRLPVTKGDTAVAPLKVNYMQLIKTVNDPDFDLTKAADIIGRDTALTISLLKMVNHRAVNSEITTIRYAAAMLGQRELKKWITTAVVRELCNDKPNEITRLSLIRAKFAENLSEVFKEKNQSAELFLMGLFSVIDIITEKPMEEALEELKVSKDIKDALVKHEGRLSGVLMFMLAYEKADFNEVSRQLLLKGISVNAVYGEYLDALKWYRDITKD